MVCSECYTMITENKYIANIKRLQSLVQEEFLVVHQLLNSEVDLDPQIFDTIIVELQAHDIIGQRIQHLIDGFQASNPFFNDKKFKNGFLDLQYFQLIALERDLEKTVGSLRAHLRANAGSKYTTLVFSRFNEIQQLIEDTNRITMCSTSERVKSGRSPLNLIQISECLNLYSMDAERIVLQWFLTNMPFGETDDLLRTYEEKMQDVSAQSVQLF
jgi:hypothetical protein